MHQQYILFKENKMLKVLIREKKIQKSTQSTRCFKNVDVQLFVNQSLQHINKINTVFLFFPKPKNLHTFLNIYLKGVQDSIYNLSRILSNQQFDTANIESEPALSYEGIMLW